MKRYKKELAVFAGFWEVNVRRNVLSNEIPDTVKVRYILIIYRMAEAELWLGFTACALLLSVMFLHLCFGKKLRGVWSIIKRPPIIRRMLALNMAEFV
jgi:hypothetical protein